ncbi:unnamed protein product [Parascedosporium putredinis]|uniref:NAD-dependent epimerase/dehydratase domain-containing protein n=1 Tax=Parascedosporium putredinis TaxID=1442378 RepID=A0A9P1MAZ7_9PEZI|nr:unnamed protein product [Parascedosporium putredinis]CAI7993650.1 unnamed protein product [Parascedosporium putredinis]
MAHQLNALPAGSTILITGVNGYIGSHIANILLGMGFRVRGAVRAPKPWLNEMFDARYGKGVFETFLLSAFDDVPVLKRAMEDVAGVLHVATDLTFGGNPEATIPWVIKASLNMLEAAASTPTVKRFVLTSSSTAVIIPVADRVGVRVTEDTYNESAVKIAWDPAVPEDSKAVEAGEILHPEIPGSTMGWVRLLLKGDKLLLRVSHPVS